MKYFYISSSTGTSGICKYSKDFYNLVLKDKGYINIDSTESVSTILSAVASVDHVHIEIGIFQKKEIEILLLMLRANYKNVSVTLHDAPLLKYPFVEFKNVLLNNFSKLFGKLGRRTGSELAYVKKIKAIYVLSQKGLEAVKKKYQVETAYYLPHVIDISEIQQSKTANNNLIYFGFIGRNKGIEYALKLHQAILSSHPEIQFYVVGKAMGKEQEFYKKLQDNYRRNVHYLGYVEEDRLSEVFDKATFAMTLFKDYKFYWPASGSILHSLKRGKIPLTNPINAIPEIIENGINGFFLSGDLKKDAATFDELSKNNHSILNTMKNNIHDYLVENHSPAIVGRKFQLA